MVNFVGTAQSYVKSLQIQQKAKKNFYEAVNNGGNKGWQSGFTLDNAASYTATSVDYYSGQVSGVQERDQKLELIILRLKQGKRLTSSEMSYLSEKDPGLYAKAVKINRERDEYEIELKRCRTKEDVRKLRVIKVQSIIPEVNKAAAKNDLSAATDIEMRLSAINDEHKTFIMSKAYERLPKNYEELEKKHAKTKAKPQSAKVKKDERPADTSVEGEAIASEEEMLQVLEDLAGEAAIADEAEMKIEPEVELEIELPDEQSDANNQKRSRKHGSKREE